MSGANSIFYGDSLLTTKNNDMKEDQELISHYRKIKDANIKELINKYLIIFANKESQVRHYNVR